MALTTSERARLKPGFDADGRMLGNFSLPAPTKPGDLQIISFTSTGVLIRNQDENGAEHLMNYALVRAR